MKPACDLLYQSNFHFHRMDFPHTMLAEKTSVPTPLRRKHGQTGEEAQTCWPRKTAL